MTTAAGALDATFKTVVILFLVLILATTGAAAWFGYQAYATARDTVARIDEQAARIRTEVERLRAAIPADAGALLRAQQERMEALNRQLEQQAATLLQQANALRDHLTNSLPNLGGILRREVPPSPAEPKP
jgi:hypothetical protein